MTSVKAVFRVPDGLFSTPLGLHLCHYSSIDVISILVLLLIAWLASTACFVGLFASSEFVLNILDHPLLGGIVMVGVNHGIDGLEVINAVCLGSRLSSWAAIVLRIEVAAASLCTLARVEQLVIESPATPVVCCLPRLFKLRLELGVDKDLCLRVNVVLVVSLWLCEVTSRSLTQLVARQKMLRNSLRLII